MDRAEQEVLSFVLDSARSTRTRYPRNFLIFSLVSRSTSCLEQNRKKKIRKNYNKNIFEKLGPILKSCRITLGLKNKYDIKICIY